MLMLTIYFFFVGAALGSFSLVLAWRMHDKQDWVRGRSKCEECGHELSALDLVPILSWVFLRGKCRYCKKPFSKQLLFAELFLGITLASSWVFWPFSLSSIAAYILFGFWMIILTLLSALFWYDFRWYLLPNKLVYSVIILSLIFAVLRGFVVDFSVWTVILQPILAAILISGLFYLMFSISRGKWIGFGDVRLGVALGLLVSSPLKAWLMIFIASIIGVILAFPSMIKGKTKLSSKIPFGPLLIIATIIVVLFGQQFIDLYLDFVGL
jgi:prepilin signal peptidase PulO-like enzyme (type II secretory pathway)